jgi:hypothetical protein
MEDSQRSTMFNAWYNSKIHITPTFKKDNEGVTLTATYEDVEYSSTCKYKDLFGSANAYNVAFNMLFSKLISVNKNIELKYDITKE